ncbi:unnamed protein product [Caenorhabditis auriculariae]|uniref:Uncharacterized protein n=1 Tax=Caenorhabditis auriculariae TaxID=2777116 RepID=A0A8S1H9B5_9PELO|nr:unnamed protein product [Caenorhabditis auriculariae]
MREIKSIRHISAYLVRNAAALLLSAQRPASPRSVDVMNFLLLAAAFIGLASAQFGKDNCNQQLFQACNSHLGQFWSVDTSTAWSDISVLDRITQNLLPSPYPIDNLVHVCNGWSNFYGCLGPQNIRNCLGLVGFVGRGMAPQMAYAYEGFLADWGFKCGAGFFAVYEAPNVASCVQNTYVNYQQESQQAFGPYLTNTTNDPANACTYAQNLMNSLQKVYQNGPCRAIDPSVAGWYGCTSAREYTNAQFYHCRHITQCATPVSPVTMRINEQTGKSEFLTGPTYVVEKDVARIDKPQRWISV